MTFAEELEVYRKNNPYQTTQIGEQKIEYLLCGNPDSKDVLVYLAGGTGRSIVWMKHVQAMEKDYRILVSEYPDNVDKAEELADLIGELVKKLQLPKVIFIGASFGGYMCQLLARKFPEITKGICLYSTSSLSEKGIEGLKKQYKSYGVMYWAIKHFPSYNFLKNIMLKASCKMVISEKEGPEATAYVKDLFTWVYAGYTREFDTHLTGLIMDIANIRPVKKEELAYLGKNILAVLPMDDHAFTPEMQQDLLDMVPDAKVVRVDGGHVATLYKVGDYVKATREFIEAL